jgi:MoaA/NifB/PqqE/SkfB family radical SAM enzyme
VRSVDDVEVPPALRHMRRFALDDALLLFDRDTGWNARCEGEQTVGLRQRAPRAIQFGITNRCNLACHFCSRDLAAASRWTAPDAFRFLAELAAAGVLEVAFGGGEPLAFAGMVDLVIRLHQETPLAVSLTTNGLLLDAAKIAALRGRHGQIRLSLYDDNDWRRTVARLADGGARFGVNYLVTPARLDSVEELVLELVALGCPDVLLLSYNGRDRALHVTGDASADLARRVKTLALALRGRAVVKLDVCWGERMEAVPRLFDRTDCGAGRDFVVVTSDRALMPCSFHHLSIPVASAAEVLQVWEARRDELARPSSLPGCARLADFGLAPPSLHVLEGP